MKVSCAGCGTIVNKKPREVRERNYCSRTCWYKFGASRPQPNRKRGQDKTCVVCGTAFYALNARSRAQCCSMPCKGIASRKMFTCETCGTTSYGSKNQAKRWCSRPCAAIARRTGQTRSCVQCRAQFYVARGRAAEGARFCSNSCHNTWQGRHKTEHTCTICGSTFRWSPSRSKSGQYNITYCSLKCRDADPARREALIAMQVRQQLGRMTKAERIGYGLLDSLGVEYQRQEPFAGKFVPDALVPTSRLVVQFDGDYWHDRAGTTTEPRIRRRVALDRSQDAYARACGWRVLRLWATDMRDDPNGCVERIRRHLHPPA